jgi:DnaJ-class molecular chaperone
MNHRDHNFGRCIPIFGQGLHLLIDEAFALFKRLGIDVRSLSGKEFTAAYFALAKRYHPDLGNQHTQELMANINAARTAILKGDQLR